MSAAPITVSLLDPGQPAAVAEIVPGAAPDERLISCIMPTRGTLHPARHAIDCFRRQTHRRRELVIACAEAGEEVRRHVEALADPAIRFYGSVGVATAGALRNFAIDRTEGELVCVWDDDDLSDPERLSRQLAALAGAKARACFLHRVLLWWPSRRQLAVSSRRVWENTMLVERAGLPRYAGSDRGNDTELARSLRAASRLVLIDRPESYCYIAHGANVWTADHFELLFANAEARCDAAAYVESLAALAARLPVAGYAAAA